MSVKFHPQERATGSQGRRGCGLLRVFIVQNGHKACWLLLQSKQLPFQMEGANKQSLTKVLCFWDNWEAHTRDTERLVVMLLGYAELWHTCAWQRGSGCSSIHISLFFPFLGWAVCQGMGKLVDQLRRKPHRRLENWVGRRSWSREQMLQKQDHRAHESAAQSLDISNWVGEAECSCS